MSTANPGRLPSVPMQIPIQGFTLEQYLQYLSWRIEVQMVAVYLHEWKKEKPQERERHKAPILRTLANANKRAEKFPATEMPKDIVDPLTSAQLDLTKMTRELTDLLGNVQLTSGTGEMEA